MRRRSFLAGAAAAGLSSAAYHLVRPLAAHAGTGAIPKRLLVVLTPNGVIERAWRPTGGETDFVLSECLEPLAAHRDRMIAFGPTRAATWNRDAVGISVHVTADGSPSFGHGYTKLLTGRNPMDGVFATGPSVDQVVARAIQGEAPFASLELGVRVGGSAGNPERFASWRDAGVVNPTENDPQTAFDRVFGAVGTPDPALERARSRRRSVLDFARGEIASIRPRLGSQDRALLDAHETAIRDLERTLSATAACAAPEGIGPLERNDWDTYTNVPEASRMQRTIAASALACDLTRVATIQYGAAAANNRHPWLGAKASEWHHSISHEAGDPVAEQAMIDVARWHAGEIAQTLDVLAAMPERDGSSVLDHTLVLWANELSDGFFHTHQNMPFVLLGSAGGALRTGRYLRYDDASHNDLLLSICHAMGLTELTSFGDPAFCSGPLPGLA